MAAKVFEVGDVLPTTTQLRIHFNAASGYEISLGLDLKSDNNNYQFIGEYGDYFYFNSSPRIDIYNREDFYFVSPFNATDHNYIDIDISSWTLSKRTISNVGDCVFTWEDLAPAPSTITNLTGTKWLLPEDLNSTSYIADSFDIDISPYEIELNTLLKLHSLEELDSITTWEELLDIAPYIITDMGGTNVVNNLVVENDKNNYLIVPTMGYLQIYNDGETSQRLYYGLDLASADNLPVVSGTLTFEHPIDGTVSLNFLELYHLFFNTSATGYWSEIPIPPGGTMLDPLLSTMTITGGDDVTNPTLIAWLEANATQIIEPSVYTITFDSNGGTTIPDIEEATELPTPLPTPTKSGYKFVAWYYESNFQTRAKAGDTIEANTTLYAKWHNLGSLFTEIADAIREKESSSGTIRDVDFGERIRGLEVGGGSSEAAMIELTSNSNCVEKVQSLNLIGTYYIGGRVYPMPLTAQLNKTSIEHNHDLIQAIFSQDITSIKSELMSYVQTNTADIGIPLPSELEGMILSYVGFAGDPNIQPSGVIHIDFHIVMSKENEVDKSLWIQIGIGTPYPNVDLMKNIMLDLGEFEVAFFYTDTSMPTTVYLVDTNTIGSYSDYLNLLNNEWTAKIEISTSF